MTSHSFPGQRTRIEWHKVTIQSSPVSKTERTHEARQVLMCLFCVELLRSSQPNGVMSSAASLPNHTFTGQA